MNFVFDVDGTLTPSRGTIDSEFKEWLLNWMTGKKVYFASGSDYAKTLEQLGEEVCNKATAIYSCAGNAVYIQGQLQRKSDFTITELQREFLIDLLEASPFPLRTGQHIEERIGLCNFSVVGRGATKEQRKQYYEYDLKTNERTRFAGKINQTFSDLEATVAGETGIDIYAKGKDKSQIADEVKPFVFFGDKIMTGGNDFTIAKRADKYHSVESWEDTFRILKKQYLK